MDAQDPSIVTGSAGPASEPRALDLVSPAAGLDERGQSLAEHVLAFADGIAGRHEAGPRIGGEPPLATRLLGRLISDDPRLGTLLDFPLFESSAAGFASRWGADPLTGYPSAYNLPRWQVLLTRDEPEPGAEATIGELVGDGAPSASPGLFAPGPAGARTTAGRRLPSGTTPQQLRAQGSRPLLRQLGESARLRGAAPAARGAVPAARRVSADAGELVRPYPRSLGGALGLQRSLVAERFALQYASDHEVGLAATPSAAAASGSSAAAPSVALLGELALSRRHLPGLGAALEALVRGQQRLAPERLTRLFAPPASTATGAAAFGAAPALVAPGGEGAGGSWGAGGWEPGSSFAQRPSRAADRALRAGLVGLTPESGSVEPVTAPTAAAGLARGREESLFRPLPGPRPLRLALDQLWQPSPGAASAGETPRPSALARAVARSEAVDRVAGLGRGAEAASEFSGERVAGRWQPASLQAPRTLEPFGLPGTLATLTADRGQASASPAGPGAEPVTATAAAASPALLPSLLQPSGRRPSVLRAAPVSRLASADPGPGTADLARPAALGSAGTASGGGGLMRQLFGRLGLSASLELDGQGAGSLLRRPGLPDQLGQLLRRLGRSPTMIQVPGQADGQSGAQGADDPRRFKGLLESVGGLLPDRAQGEFRQGVARALAEPGVAGPVVGLRGEAGGTPPAATSSAGGSGARPGYYEAPRLVGLLGRSDRLGDLVRQRREQGSRLLGDRAFLPGGTQRAAGAAEAFTPGAIPRPGGLAATHGFQLDVDFVLMEAMDAWESAFPGRTPYMTPRGPGEGKDEPDFRQAQPFAPADSPLPPRARDASGASKAAAELMRAMQLDQGDRQAEAQGPPPGAPGAESALTMTLIRPVMRKVVERSAPLFSQGTTGTAPRREMGSLGDKKSDYDPDRIEALIDALYERIWDLMDLEKQRRGWL